MGHLLYDIIKERIVVLDGALGTMVQGLGLTEEDYRGGRFAGSGVPLKGCNDVLALTRPDAIGRIHDAYLAAGADIVSTDTFNATSLSLADYGLADHAYEINRAAAALARGVADGYTLRNPAKPRFVAGSMGPTGRTASISARVDDPASREVTFDELAAAYGAQAAGLVDGGADLLLLETVFDTLNAKAAIFAIESECEKRGVHIPLIISGTLADASGRTLSGQVVEAFYASIKHARPLAVGFNCAYGARQMRPYVARLAGVCEFAVSAHPNAGLPNVEGGYDETAAMMAADIEDYLRDGLLNIVGGCCGTTPAHIGAIAAVAGKYAPRPLPAPRHETVLSGLEPLRITPESNFINIGERANVAGSAKFARLIREGDYEQAISIARSQIEAGARIVDVCMDDGLIDGAAAMTRFLNLAMSEPEIARVPMMIDSSSWEVLEAGLKCVQGKSLVNSISLKEGADEFLRRARLIRRYGAAAVVMLFDERGQADTYERKTEVAARACEILVRDGFPPEDIVFDPNVLAVATGIAEHDGYGVAFIEACRWIKQNLPLTKVSGGVSNLSFAFRGNNAVREAMHAVFLYHAIAAGMDMGIVNPAMLRIHGDIDPELLELAEDVVLDRRPDATERLAAYAETVKGAPEDKATPGAAAEWRGAPVGERVEYAMMRGVTDFIADDTLEALEAAGSPMAVIDDMLMPAMGRIGELFAEGRMFLPQVVKSARVMRRAVDALTPYIERGKAVGRAGRVLIATVKGDVHDIGKNIVSVVMSCNGYDVADLGVMVECETIVSEAQRTGADVVALSGLISPSLAEMTRVVAEMERRGMTTPVVIGGATTSAMHTALRIAPAYSGAVVHSRDASENAAILARLFGPGREEYIAEVKTAQAELREQFERGRDDGKYVSPARARANRRVKPAEEIVLPRRLGRKVFRDFPIAEAVPYIDWGAYLHAWDIRGTYPEVLSSPEKGGEARRLIDEAKELLARIEREKLLELRGVVEMMEAVADGDDIVVKTSNGPRRLAQLRNQESGRAHNPSLADNVTDADSGHVDYVCAFALTAGVGLERLATQFREAGDDYSAIAAKLLADRLTEALAEAVHSRVRRELWGYERDALPAPESVLRGDYRGVRVAFGYPACPDHSLKQDVFEIMDVTSETGMELTENYMIRPGEALCGLMFAGYADGYFGVGRIDREQLEDYARRRGKTTGEIERLIPKNIR